MSHAPDLWKQYDIENSVLYVILHPPDLLYRRQIDTMTVTSMALAHAYLISGKEMSEDSNWPEQ